jgi:UDP-2,3-diacylglucosamine hydrolase
VTAAVASSPARVVLASDFHLTPDQPAGIELFVRFVREAVAGASAFYVLGDLFEAWTGRANLRVPGYEPVFAALRALAADGTEVALFHGNRDFLMGRAEGNAAGGRVVGEELAVALFGRRYLLLHGDSLCTDDVGYQRSKRWMRSGILHALARVAPLRLQLAAARAMRRASRRSTAQKTMATMGIVGAAVRDRFAAGYDALVCGHVHDPGLREYGTAAARMPLFVLGDWHESGVYATIDAAGVRLRTFPEGS